MNLLAQIEPGLLTIIIVAVVFVFFLIGFLYFHGGI